MRVEKAKKRGDAARLPLLRGKGAFERTRSGGGACGRGRGNTKGREGKVS